MKHSARAGEALFSRIGTGKANAVLRPCNDRDDRGLRKLVEEAQGQGDIIINIGGGYYRPDLNNPEEAAEYRHYIAQKKSRIRAHEKTIQAMENAAARFNTATPNLNKDQ